ncbi:AAA family ATPase [Methanococcoides sp. SA1]|nr:AAA family ATPase [Methanococcoides sp. SA1]
MHFFFLHFYFTQRVSLNNPSGALKNLLELADINIIELWNNVKKKDLGKISYIEEIGNKILEQKFNERWKQHNIYIKLKFEPEYIRIFIPSAKTYSNVSERSDGLKFFIALFAFVQSKNESIDPIILIDEAETHLHYDAQVDLVKVLETQQSASKIIYTTHSAGCLPTDYTSSIRIVKPEIGENRRDTGISTIENCFWKGGPGISPIRLAMGASTLNSSKYRRTLFTEGITDTILLPKLLKDAKEINNIEFQVLPGLSEANFEQIINISDEVANTLYLFDNDDGGKRHAKELIDAGIEKENILYFEDSHEIEDYIKTEKYLSATNEILSKYTKLQISLEKPENQSIKEYIETWSSQNKIKPPNRRNISEIIVTQKTIIKPEKKTFLISLYNTILRKFVN